MTIGQRIKEARKNSGISQKDLAEKLGVSASMIGQYENDLRKPKFETQQKIANALGVDVYIIFSDVQRELYVQGEADTIISYLENGYRFTKEESDLVKYFNSLNEEAQIIAISRVEELTEIPKYKRKPQKIHPDEIDSQD